MRNDVEKKQMVCDDNTRFNALRDIRHFAEPPKIEMWNGTAKCQMEQPNVQLNSQMSNGTAKCQMEQSNDMTSKT